MPELAIDGALSAAGAVAGLIDHLDALAPFGAANPEPRFAFPGLVLAHVEPVGTGHLRCTLADPLGRPAARPGSTRSPFASPRRRSAHFSSPRAAALSISPAICGATTTAAAMRCSW